MATKKRSGARKAKSKEKPAAAQPLVPAVPPPDNPLLRFTVFDADREFHSKEMAEKRLEAIRHTQAMPTSEEDAAATTDTAPEQTANATRPDSADED